MYGCTPTNGINISYVLIASTVETQTSTELAVSLITFKASPDCTTNLAPPSNTCNDDPEGILDTSFTR